MFVDGQFPNNTTNFIELIAHFRKWSRLSRRRSVALFADVHYCVRQINRHKGRGELSLGISFNKARENVLWFGKTYFDGI